MPFISCCFHLFLEIPIELFVGSFNQSICILDCKL